MNLGQITILVFGLLVEAGGFVGFLKAGSKPSLIAGLASGGMLFAAFGVTFFSMITGLWVGAGVSVLLAVVFLMRLMKTKKFMPSGMLLALSIVSAGILIKEALGHGSVAG